MIWIGFIIVFIIAAMVKSVSDMDEKTVSDEGLPRIDLTSLQCEGLPANVHVNMTCKKDNISIRANGYTKDIPYSDIIDMTLESVGSDHTQFSASRAIAGTVLLGGIGAIAGVSGKKEDMKTLVLSYRNGDKVNYMVFLQSTDNGKQVKYEAHVLSRAYEDIVKLLNTKRQIIN